MRLIIRDDPAAASAYVANYIVNRINRFAPTPERPFVLGLPTGSTPEGVYRILVEKYKAGEVSFENVITFNMDEYVSLPTHHPQSYHAFMFRHLFSHINIPPNNVHILNGNAPNLAAECTKYESAILAVGGIELFLAGLGEDGHIAFNEPGSSLASRTRVETLAESTVLANSRFFGGDGASVPRQALTVGVRTVMEAREVVVMAFGPRKAAAVKQCVEGGVSQMWTASALQLHPNAAVVCDEEATGELMVKTVKYFKHLSPPTTHQDLTPSRLLFNNFQPNPNITPITTTTSSSPHTTLSQTPTPTAMDTSTANSSIDLEAEPISPPPVGHIRVRVSHREPYVVFNSAYITPPDRDRDGEEFDPDELIPDRMASRIGDPELMRRATPQPPSQHQQQQQQQQQQQPVDDTPGGEKA